MTTPIATAAQILAYGGIQNTTASLAVMNEIMPGTLAAIGSFCNRNFTSQSYTETRNGNGGRRMQLANYPITSFASLTIDDNAIPLSTSTTTMGYLPALGGRSVIVRGYCFTQCLQNVVAAFTAGYGDASGPGGEDLQPWPADLQQAFMICCLARYNERTRYGVQSKMLAGENISYSDGAAGGRKGADGIPPAARSILYNYMNTIPETGF